MTGNKKTNDLTKWKREIPYGLILVFLGLSFIIVFAGYTYYNSYKKTLLNNVKKELISICDLKVNQLVLWRKERLGDANSILNNVLIADEISNFLKDPAHQAGKEKILSWLNQTRDSYDYKEVAVFDSKGKVIFSTEKDIHQDEFHIRSSIISLEKQKVVVGDLHKDQTTGEIGLGLFIPFFISSGAERNAAGGIMLLTDPEKFLYPLIQSWPVPSETAETLLVKQDGSDVLYLNELRHKKNTALSFRVPISNESLPAAMAVRGIEGVIEGIDYRNIPVKAAIKKVPDTGWYFIAKMDLEEAYRSAETIDKVISAFVIVGILTAGLGIGLFWRNKKAIFYRRLYEAQEALRESETRFRSLIKLAPIPLCFVNREGGLIYINDRFIQLFGYTLADVPTLKAWWHLACPEESYRRWVIETWEEAVARASREETDIAPLECKVTCKNGTVRIMEISGITIKDNFLASFIDLTERKKAEEAFKLNEDRLEALLKLTLMKVSSEKEITDFALEEAVRLTRSKGGYLHFFNEDEQTIQLYSWSNDVLNTCSAEKNEHYPIDKAGIWADSVRFKRAVVHNDYQNLTEKKGYPEGHFDLFRHLGAPIFEKDRIVGVMGVGNKEEPYNQTDVRQLTLLLDSMWGILKQKQMGIEREKLIKQLQESLANVKTLSGMLPICASCKKIRDDKGYWKQVESYVSEHTEAVFSHGICPECAKKAYEELEKFKKDGNL